MKAHRKIIVYIATSADGYIARPNGDVEWLNRRPRKFDYGMTSFYRTIDTILWGRKTYDWVLSYHKKKGQKEGMFDRKVSNYVFSKAAETGSTRGRIRVGAGESIRAASSSDAGKTHLDDGRG
jgi:dihydrofolate reductase